jgi:hypothetical protein
VPEAYYSHTPVTANHTGKSASDLTPAWFIHLSDGSSFHLVQVVAPIGRKMDETNSEGADSLDQGRAQFLLSYHFRALTPFWKPSRAAFFAGESVLDVTRYSVGTLDWVD